MHGKLVHGLLFIGGLLSWPLPTAQASFQGYSKVFIQSYKPNDQPHSHIITAANRLSLLHQVGSTTWESSLQLLVDKGEATDQQTGSILRSSPYRIKDRPDPFAGNRAKQLHAYYNLDRAFLTYQMNQADLVIGRQPLSLGTSLFINPIDVFNPLAINSIDTEERAGVDAIRFKIYPQQAVIDAGWLIGPDGADDKQAYFLRYLASLSAADISFILSRFQQRQMLGTDIQTQYEGTGIRASVAAIEGNQQSFVRASLGADRVLPDDWMVAAEYHFNGIGETGFLLRTELVQDQDWQVAQIRYLGRHYFSASVSKAISALTALAGASTFNTDDRSSLNSVQFTYNIRQDHYLVLGGLISQGKTKTEFSAYGDLLYGSYRLYY